MPMRADEIERLIKAKLPDADVTIQDLAGDGDHYAAHVASAAFKGLSRVRQHQLVYDAFGGQMGDTLHALALTTAVKADERGPNPAP
jgi:stress-induced morphogen